MLIVTLRRKLQESYKSIIRRLDQPWKITSHNKSNRGWIQESPLRSVRSCLLAFNASTLFSKVLTLLRWIVLSLWFELIGNEPEKLVSLLKYSNEIFNICFSKTLDYIKVALFQNVYYMIVLLTIRGTEYTSTLLCGYGRRRVCSLDFGTSRTYLVGSVTNHTILILNSKT